MVHQTRQAYCAQLVLDKTFILSGVEGLSRDDGVTSQLRLKAQFLCTKKQVFYGRSSVSHPITLYADKGRGNELSVHPGEVAKRLNEVQFFFFSRATDADTLIALEFQITQSTGKTLTVGFMVL